MTKQIDSQCTRCQIVSFGWGLTDVVFLEINTFAILFLDYICLLHMFCLSRTMKLYLYLSRLNLRFLFSVLLFIRSTLIWVKFRYHNGPAGHIRMNMQNYKPAANVLVIWVWAWNLLFCQWTVPEQWTRKSSNTSCSNRLLLIYGIAEQFNI